MMVKFSSIWAEKGCFVCAAFILTAMSYVAFSQGGWITILFDAAVRLISSHSLPFPGFNHWNLSDDVRFNTTGVSRFQTVTVGEAYVYSAYLDGRPTPDVRTSSSRPILRIVSFFLRKMAIVDRYFCLFSYDGIKFENMSRVVSVTDLNAFDRDLEYKVGLINCELPMVSDGTTPVLVSVVDFYSTSASNLLEIIDLRTRMEKFKRSSSVVNFTICTSPLHDNYPRLSDLIEFIEINRIFGAQKFIFYLESVPDDVRSCLTSYEKRGIVEVMEWNLPKVGGGLHYHGQIVAISECLYRTMYLTRYMVNQDLDEFVVPMRTPNWSLMLDSIHRRPGLPPTDDIASYNVRNLFFPTSSPDDDEVEKFETRNSSLVTRYGIKTLLKTANVGYVNPSETRSKSIGRPERILMWHVHAVMESSLVRRRDENVVVDVEDGLLFHYRDAGEEEEAGHGVDTRIRRMHNFSSEIIRRIGLARRWCSLP